VGVLQQVGTGGRCKSVGGGLGHGILRFTTL
jgi:hypothetical protein